MTIFSGINSIGGGLRVTNQITSQTPESIVIDALGYSIDHAIIPGQIFTILKTHARLFDKNIFDKLLIRLLKNLEKRGRVSLVFSYSILKKTGMLSNERSREIIKKVKGGPPELYFGGDYKRLANLTTIIAAADSEFLDLGFTIPEIMPAPLKSIATNPLEFSHLNQHMKKRVCQLCGSHTIESPMQESKLLKSFDTAFSNKLTYRICASCGEISRREQIRLTRFQKKTTAKMVRECIFKLKRDYKVKERIIAERIGVSPEHLSNIKHGNYLPSVTLLRLLVEQTKTGL